MTILVYLKQIKVCQAIELDLEEIVITATRTPQGVKDIGTNVTVITNKELQDLKVDSLGNVLNKIAGMGVKK